ncbi:hypothetical protein [Streptomyces lavendulocolor]|uniref:hypothetical protein n=1 Tax=Streptomyces lavendulocolor TaxID=67316 RepID=UPI003C2CF598
MPANSPCWSACRAAPYRPGSPPGDRHPATAVRRRYAGWPAPADPASGYARLLAHLAAHTGPGPVDVDDALLDALGAPPADGAPPPWPPACAPGCWTGCPTRWPGGLLTGAPGALSALLTAGGAPRDWLPCLGLR